MDREKIARELFKVNSRGIGTLSFEELPMIIRLRLFETAEHVEKLCLEARKSELKNLECAGVYINSRIKELTKQIGELK